MNAFMTSKTRSEINVRYGSIEGDDDDGVFSDGSITIKPGESIFGWAFEELQDQEIGEILIRDINA